MTTVTKCITCGGSGVMPADTCTCPSGKHTCTPQTCTGCEGSGHGPPKFRMTWQFACPKCRETAPHLTWTGGRTTRPSALRAGEVDEGLRHPVEADLIGGWTDADDLIVLDYWHCTACGHEWWASEPSAP